MYLMSTFFVDEDDPAMHAKNAMNEAKFYTGVKRTTLQGQYVRARACQSYGPSQEPWYDSAVVEFDASNDPNTTRWQLGYVQILVCFEAYDSKLMLVRWYTSANLGDRIQNTENEFESHHIRNLPRLKWNMRNQRCNRSLQILPVSSLKKIAWVHEDFHSKGIFWHIHSTKLYMHQDPAQAML